jgi:hypothetical protein
MWHTPNGKKMFTGPYSLALAYALSEMVERLEYCYDVDHDDYQFGYKAFANQTLGHL